MDATAPTAEDLRAIAERDATWRREVAESDARGASGPIADLPPYLQPYIKAMGEGYRDRAALLALLRPDCPVPLLEALAK